MPSGARIQVEGVSSLARAFRKAGEEGARDFLIAANKEAAATVEAAARPLVPTRNGSLLATLKSSGAAKGGVVQIGRARVPYAGPVHFGWFKPRVWGSTTARRPIRPNPFLFEALDKRRAQVEETYFKRLDELLGFVTKEANSGD